MEHTREGALLLVRMDPGEEVLPSLLAAMEAEGARSGLIVSGIGALDGLEVGYYNPSSNTYDRKRMDGSHELVSMSGTVGWDGELGFQPHIHVALGSRLHALHGGHLFEARVSVTAEIALRVVPEGVIRREPKEGSLLSKMRLGEAAGDGQP